MIRDLSLTLRALLTQSGLPADIRFDRPGDTFTPGQTTIDLFLYDIRENLELRNAEPVIERINGQAVRRPPPMRVACTYLVTAWVSGDTEISLLQEHHLLAQVLPVFARYPTIPASFLQDSLRGQQPPLPLLTSQPDGLKEPAEFWSAIGGRLRPSLSVTATIGLELFAAETLPLVTKDQMEISIVQRPSISGRVLAADGAAAAGAAVSLIEAGLSTATGANGRYSFGPVAPGRYTLRAQLGASVGTRQVVIPPPSGSPPGADDIRLAPSPSP